MIRSAMFGFLSKRLVVVVVVVVFPNIITRPLLHHNTSFIKSFSSKTKNKDENYSFTVSYLINSCGLSPETALSISQKVHFQSSHRPDSVLTLLRHHGFTNTHISKLVRLRPSLLLAHPQKTLLPKFEFFYSIGVSRDSLARFLSSNPRILASSLAKSLIPCYNFLKSVVLLDAKVVSALKRLSWFSLRDVEKTIAPNIAVLKEVGVPESLISSFVSSHPTAVAGNCDKFKKSVEKVIEMGFSTSRLMFLQATQVTSQMTKSTWERKMEVYRRWGWSDDEIRLAFRIQPICMNLSEQKIMSGMDFLVNKMGWQPAAIARVPSVLFFSLEKRIFPRCSVIKVIMLKGLIKKNASLYTFLNTFLKPTDKYFLDKFVIKYQEHVPQLLSVYQGKMGLLELGFGSEEIYGMKQL